MRAGQLVNLIATIALVLSPAAAMADHVSFDNGIVGTMFGQPVGTPPGSLLFSQDGTDVIITPLVSSGIQSYNFCSIENSIGGQVNFHQNNIMSLQGVGLIFDFTGSGDVRFEYLHTGGTVNLQVNGYGAVIEEQSVPAMAGILAPGIFMTATSTPVSGGYKGTVTITGLVQSLRIGGGELYLDDVFGGGDTAPGNCDYEVNHQTLALGDAWGVSNGNSAGDVLFNEDAIPVSCEIFHISNSASTMGDCRITTTPVNGFGFDKVMRCQDINNKYDIGALGIATEMVSFEFLNDGSLENLQVNGAVLYRDIFENMPADVASGVSMTVTSYPSGTGTKGRVRLTGNVETLLVGGRVLYLDNLCVTQGGVSAAADDIVSAGLQMKGNYPNPFNPGTTINYSVLSGGSVELSVFDVSGARVVTLVNQHLEAGRHEVYWNGRNSAGRLMATGVYFAQLHSGGHFLSHKLTMIK